MECLKAYFCNNDEILSVEVNVLIIKNFIIMLQLRIIKNSNEWRTVISCFPWFDYVHTYDFHALSQSLGEGDPILFVVDEGEGNPIMCWPALSRVIPGTDWYDLTSVYGYGGPLIRNPEYVDESFSIICNYWRDMEYVSVFSRMHPLLQSGEYEFAKNTAWISDIAVINVKGENDLLSTYSKGHRRDIKKLQNIGAEVFVDHELRFLSEFIEIYYESMDALNARPYFYYSKDYFLRILNAVDFDAYLNFTRIGDELISGGIDIIGRKVMHTYLGGGRIAYRKLATAKMEYWNSHKRATSEKMQNLILGAGRPGVNDSLLKFKQDFGASIYPLHIYKEILNKKKYDELCKSKMIDPAATKFFPAYRNS